MAAGWHALPGRARTAVGRLAALPVAPFTVADAAAVLGGGHEAARRELESLIDDGVIVPPSGEVTAHAAWYELPRLTHLYVRGLLRGDDPGGRG